MTTHNPFSTPITPDMIERILEIDPRDVTPETHVNRELLARLLGAVLLPDGYGKGTEKAK